VTGDKAIGVCPDLNTIGNSNAIFDPGETIVCSGSYAITQADVNAGSVTNIATASVGGTTSIQANAVVRMAENKALTLTRTVSSTTYSQAGQTITFTYEIRNTGPVPLGPAQFVVSDDRIPAAINCGPPDTTLIANQAVSCTATYTVADADLSAGSLTSNARASGGGAVEVQPASLTLSNTNVAGAPNASSYVSGSTIQHRVEAGEWLMQIARCYGADVSATRRANPLLNPARISINTVVTVPNIGSSGRIYGPPCVRPHTVQAGDTWNSIAQSYNADVAVLQAANRNAALTAGRVIRVPVNSAGGNPQPLPTPGTPVPVTPAPTACNRMQFVADVSVPDNQSVPGSSTFTKTWRLRNTGTCTWTTGYVVTWASGERMEAPDTVQLTAADVAPNGTVDVSVNLRAPATAGTYQANFRLRAPDGTVFGNFWVKIVVP
jgi:uncharacterized repeat protein (TIGR01451 family)